MRVKLLLCLTCVVLMAGCGRATPKSTPAASVPSMPPSEHVYRTVDGVPLKAFVFRPAVSIGGARTPAILLFHGGGWVAGAPDWGSPVRGATRTSGWWRIRFSIESRRIASRRSRPWTTSAAHFAGHARRPTSWPSIRVASLRLVCRRAAISRQPRRRSGVGTPTERTVREDRMHSCSGHRRWT